MIRFKKDLLIISFLGAAIAGVWFVISLFGSTSQNEIINRQTAKLLKPANYKIDKNFWRYLKSTREINYREIYDRELQPLITTKRNIVPSPSSSPSPSLTPTATASAQTPTVTTPSPTASVESLINSP